MSEVAAYYAEIRKEIQIINYQMWQMHVQALGNKSGCR